MFLNPRCLPKTRYVLSEFISNYLGLSENSKLSGQVYFDLMIECARSHTYLETISNKADSLFLRLNRLFFGFVSVEVQLLFSRNMYKKFCTNKNNLTIAFDITPEKFYGKLEGFDIHGTNKRSINGEFKFLSCCIVDGSEENYMLATVPVKLGHNTEKVVGGMLDDLYRVLGLKPKLILFDREFYKKKLMNRLSNMGQKYLIFTPKNKMIKRELNNTKKGERRIVYDYEYKFSEDKSTHRNKTNFILVRDYQYRKKNGKVDYDWTFATNLEGEALKKLTKKAVKKYKKRWNIETNFRVHDEARIKTKSKSLKNRFFFFAFNQMLLTTWQYIYKKKGVTFKNFIIELHRSCNQKRV